MITLAQLGIALLLALSLFVNIYIGILCKMNNTLGILITILVSPLVLIFWRIRRKKYIGADLYALAKSDFSVRLYVATLWLAVINIPLSFLPPKLIDLYGRSRNHASSVPSVQTQNALQKFAKSKQELEESKQELENSVAELRAIQKKTMARYISKLDELHDPAHVSVYKQSLINLGATDAIPQCVHILRNTQNPQIRVAVLEAASNLSGIPFEGNGAQEIAQNKDKLSSFLAKLIAWGKQNKMDFSFYDGLQ